MNTNTVKLPEDMTIDGKEYKKGTVLVQGANCPMCKHFHLGATQVTKCNNCGFTIKALKPHQLKKKLKREKRDKYLKEI